MVLEVTYVEPLEGYRLRLAFNDGSAGVVDVEPFLWGEQFEELREPARFNEVFLDKGMGTVAWPNEADLAPVTLRERLEVEQDTVAATPSVERSQRLI
jgi:hypothetical protein